MSDNAILLAGEAHCPALPLQWGAEAGLLLFLNSAKKAMLGSRSACGLQQRRHRWGGLALMGGYPCSM
jgi:hypothetical protein